LFWPNCAQPVYTIGNNNKKASILRFCFIFILQALNQRKPFMILLI
jgi:hypothetical protein